MKVSFKQGTIVVSAVLTGYLIGSVQTPCTPKACVDPETPSSKSSTTESKIQVKESVSPTDQKVEQKLSRGDIEEIEDALETLFKDDPNDPYPNVEISLLDNLFNIELTILSGTWELLTDSEKKDLISLLVKETKKVYPESYPVVEVINQHGRKLGKGDFNPWENSADIELF